MDIEARLCEYFDKTLLSFEVFLQKHIAKQPDAAAKSALTAAKPADLGARVGGYIHASMASKYPEVMASLYEQQRELRLEWYGHDWIGPQNCCVIEDRLADFGCKGQKENHHHWTVPSNVIAQLVARACIDGEPVNVGEAGAWDGHSGDDYRGRLKVNAAVPCIGRRGRQAASEAQEHYVRTITAALLDPVLKYARGKLLSLATNPRIDVAWIPPAETLSLETELPAPGYIKCAVLLNTGKQYLIDIVKAKVPAQPKLSQIDWTLWQSYCDKDQ